MRQVTHGKKNLWAVILVGLCLLLPIQKTTAATFSAGVKTPGQTPEQKSAALKNDLDAALADLDSDKVHEVISAVRFFNKKLPELLTNKFLDEEIFRQVLTTLAAASFNVRLQSEMFLNDHIRILLKHNLVSVKMVNDYAMNIQRSDEDYIIFLNLIQSLLKNKSIKKELPQEHGLAIIEALRYKSEILASLSSSLFTNYGDYLVENRLINQEHISRFAAILQEIPVTSLADYVKILEGNLPLWIKSKLINKQQIRSILFYVPLFPEEQQQRLFTFVNKDQMDLLLDAGVFEREWFIEISHILDKGDKEKRNHALALISHYLGPFIRSGVVDKGEFNALWGQVEGHHDIFTDPYKIIALNFKELERLGWFTKKHYQGLVAGISKKLAPSQIRQLELLDTLYDWLEEKGWLNNAALVGFLTAHHSRDKNLEIQKLKFADNHEGSLLHSTDFSTGDLERLLNRLRDPDEAVFEQTLQIIHKGFTKWHEGKTLTPELMTTVFAGSQGNSFKTSELLGLVSDHFENTSTLYEGDLIQTFCDFINSSEQKISQSAVGLFTDNIETIKNNLPLSPACRKTLEGKGIMP